ncbi:pseudouridine synthase [Paenibacillus tritici]|uniref:Pseudouridine synthase n=1 Tax=Paenibacillus tritici TaxID=1873425 RepID=A0ABX2DH69_9BACL|nr:pseudouridine synthase [Paenibacillus tritici]NQX43950.1 pseudouridine synthase [Paenibacillus tritici]QUL57513.1 pseudouridine synthase [Paenibacillus tritici]
MRIDKYISETGVYPRRETGRLLAAGRITINGQACAPGAIVEPGDTVAVDGIILTPDRGERVYLALNKPVGITCTAAREVEGNIVDYVNYPSRIFAVGRLDKHSEGLILMTNDGSIVNRMMRSEHSHEKEYTVTVDKQITEGFLEEMSAGVDILETRTRPCLTRRISEHEFSIILTQGLNLQIRRMCKALGYRVLRLERVRIMHLTLTGLERGQWRRLTLEEVAELHARLEE